MVPEAGQPTTALTVQGSAFNPLLRKLKAGVRFVLLLQVTSAELYILHSRWANQQIVDSIQVLAVEKTDLHLAPPLL